MTQEQQIAPPTTTAKLDRLTLYYALGLGVFVLLFRLAPVYYPPSRAFLWNLAPIGALTLFIGARVRSWYGFLIPLGVMFLADLLLIAPYARDGGYSSISWRTPLIYACLAVYLGAGWLLPARTRSPLLLGGAALLGGLQFFLVTNFAAWLADTTLYTKDLPGLLSCYTAALPFYRNTLTGDLLFTGLFFALHEGLLLLAAWEATRKEAKVPA